MKNASRSKLLHCFRPMDEVIEPDIDDLSGLACLNIENNANQEYQMRLVSEKKLSLSRAVKAVFFETILAKRIRDRSYKQRSKEICNDEMKLSSSSSTTTTSRFSSSSSASTSDSAKHEVDNEDRVAENKSKENSDHHCGRGNNIGLYLFLISLAITVMFGRILAIVFTSIWLYVLFIANRLSYETKTKV